MHLFRSLSVLTRIFALCSAYTNPIRQEWGADPTIAHSDDGHYYLLSTSDSDVQITRATTIEGLKTGEKKVVYAPEIHQLSGRWYIYFTTGRGSDLDGQRSHVLAGGASPWDGFDYAGAIVGNEWAIDGTVLKTENFGNFFVYSCFNGLPFQSICIQPLNKDNISVRGESPNYCLGLLTWDGSTDPMNRAAWSKSDGCVMSSANGHFSTGHNSFLQVRDGIWNVYHAAANPDGACDKTRYTIMQPLEVNGDGTPRFQQPAPFSQEFPEPPL